MKVELIDHMGSDLSVCNAARVSFAKESDWASIGKNVLKETDTRLIKYLAKHNHWTPFGHCFASFRIKAPLFCARQLGKHQVGLCWNEESRRYIDSEPEFYTPDMWRKRADNVKQGSSDEAAYMMVDIHGEEWLVGDVMKEAFNDSLSIYRNALKAGICPEQARMVLPQSMYTEWVWSGSLAAFARVCKLRLDPHTQYETRLIAEQISENMSELFPISWEALRSQNSDQSSVAGSPAPR